MVGAIYVHVLTYRLLIFYGIKMHFQFYIPLFFKCTLTIHIKCLKIKQGDLFLDHCLHQIRHKSAGYIFNFKCGIHSSDWSRILFLFPYQGA